MERKPKIAIMVVSILALFLLSYSYHPGCMFPDESSNYVVASSVLSGSYAADIFHRPPLFPVFSAMFILVGFGFQGTRAIVTTLSIIAALYSTYLLSSEIQGKKKATLATILLLSCPFLWRWGTKLMTDIPLLAAVNLAFYFAIRDDKKGVLASVLALIAGVLIKRSAVVAIPFVAYALVRERKLVLSTIHKQILGALTVIGALAFISMFDVTAIISQNSVIKAMLTGGLFPSISYLYQLALFPVLLFLPFGLKPLLRKRRGKTLIAFSATYFLLILSFWVLRIRYLSPLFAIAIIACVEGYDVLKNRFAGKADLALVVLIAASLASSLMLVQLDSDAYCGSNELVQEVRGLDGTIASEYYPDYLASVTGKDVREIPYDMEYVPLKRNTQVEEVSDSDHVILSTYAEFEREPTTQTFYPKVGSFEISLLERPYSNGRVPEDYVFSSDTYVTLEGDADFESKQIGEGPTFIIYSRK